MGGFTPLFGSGAGGPPKGPQGPGPGDGGGSRPAGFTPLFGGGGEPSGGRPPGFTPLSEALGAGFGKTDPAPPPQDLDALLAAAREEGAAAARDELEPVIKDLQAKLEAVAPILEEVERLRNDEIRKAAEDVGTLVIAVCRRVLGESLAVHPDALPALVKLASQTDDPEELTYLVNAFADTTGIGSVEGMDKEIAGKAAEAIRKLGPELPARAVEQSRITLRTLGDEEGSDQFAQHRWPDRFDEHYRYAVTVTEVAKCKNGKTRANLHVAAFDEGGMQWPDQIQPQLLGKLKYEWELDTADRCKGEGTFDVVMSEEPFESDEARDKWIEETVLRFEEKAGSYDKAKVFKHESFDY